MPRLTGEVKLAATVLAIRGPCRQQGDSYLACVALKGKGECQSLRHLYEGCMQQNVSDSLMLLTSMSRRMCPEEKGSEDAVLQCAANRVVGQHGL